MGYGFLYQKLIHNKNFTLCIFKGMITSPFCEHITNVMNQKRKRAPIPIWAIPEKYVYIAVQGICPVPVTFEDECLNKAVDILIHSLKGVYSAYGKKNYYFEPILEYQYDNKCLLLKVALYNKKKK